MLSNPEKLSIKIVRELSFKEVKTVITGTPLPVLENNLLSIA